MKYLVIGAGPAGLTFACRLKQLGENDFLVLEKEKEAGGLCRSAFVDGAPLDVGGGHFLDTCRPEVNNFLFSFMPEREWNIFERNSCIELDNQTISHPLESNIWQMNLESQVEYLKSIAAAGCNTGKEKPGRFTEWIYWKLGERIAEHYMVPYNRKMFGDYLDNLGTYWLEKLPDVSFEETLRSCLEKKAYGKQPGHARFYYPKQFGYGELWHRMAKNLGNHLVLSQKVNSIDFDTHTVRTYTGGEFQADFLVSTIPWKEYKEIKGMPRQLQESVRNLQHTAIRIDYFDRNLDTDAHWIYNPNPEVCYHRILVRNNFCPGSKGYWTEANCERDGNDCSDIFSFQNDYAYPVNTVEKPMIMENLLKWTEGQSVYGLGRWGEHQHYNSDVTVERALKLAEKLKTFNGENVNK